MKKDDEHLEIDCELELVIVEDSPVKDIMEKYHQLNIKMDQVLEKIRTRKLKRSAKN